MQLGNTGSNETTSYGGNLWKKEDKYFPLLFKVNTEQDEKIKIVVISSSKQDFKLMKLKIWFLQRNKKW